MISRPRVFFSSRTIKERGGGGVKPPKPPRIFSFDVFAVHERDYYLIPGRVGYSGIIVEDMQ